jgi:2-keto-4-pentenoate hydratase/2-oxohepta-3-ene-1,7-dioic acid hydratase in catechol pathway
MPRAASNTSRSPITPTLFARWTQSLTISGDQIPVPSGERGLDWEGEIVAYVGSELTDADEDEALSAVVGYSTFNDLTSRIAQKLSSQWILGKNGDKSGPLGPIVPAGEVGDLRDGLRVQTRVNGEVVQDGNTADIVYTVGSTLSLISHTLHPPSRRSPGHRNPRGRGILPPARVAPPPWRHRRGRGRSSRHTDEHRRVERGSV